MIKLSIKSKKNNCNNYVNVSSIKTSFWDKDGEKFFVNERFLDKGRTIVLSVTCPPQERPSKGAGARGQLEFWYDVDEPPNILGEAPYLWIVGRFLGGGRSLLIFPGIKFHSKNRFSQLRRRKFNDSLTTERALPLCNFLHTIYFFSLFCSMYIV